MNIGFDVISDLNLGAEDSFNWENKATSLYLIIAGNISDDLRVIHQTLLHLSRFYQGIFYVPGTLEHDSLHLVKNRYLEINQICKSINNVAFLHRHVVVINGVAILGANGWYGSNIETPTTLEKLHLHSQHIEDISYVGTSLEKLQLHLDVKKVIVVTHCVPGPNLYFGEQPDMIGDQIPLTQILGHDSEHKVSTWIYGSYDKNVDTTIENINYINNSYYGRRPYWPKRIDIEV
jgi:hypothetical protein